MSEIKRSIQRWLLGIPRAFFPVLTLGERTFVFRYADVKEILERDQDFTLRQVNYENIARHIGPFILGMDDGPEYQRDLGMLRKAVRKDDGERIRAAVRKNCQEAVAGLEGEFDLVKSYTRLIPWQLQRDYFGVPGPDMETMWRWGRALFWDIFLDLTQDAEIRAAAETSAKEMNAYLQELISDAAQVMNGGGRLRDSMINRLITMQPSAGEFMTNEWIAGNMAGVYMGGLEPLNKAVCNVTGQFLARPEVMDQARSAAQADDVDAMAGLAWEAMRFHPNAPLLMRYSEREQHIGGGERRKRRIKGGKTLFLMSGAAMFDEDAFPQPKSFLPDRPFNNYLYFGHGLHKCFGNYINLIVIPEMLVALLKTENLEPVLGSRGKVKNEGPFPDQWIWRRK